IPLDTEIEFEDGLEPQNSSAGKLETAILNIIAREFRPYNMQVVVAGSRNFNDVQADLESNNPVIDPGGIAPNIMFPPGRTGPTFNPAQVNPATTLPDQYKDIYIFIVGCTTGGQQEGNLTSTLAVTEPNEAAIFPFVNHPTFPGA